MMVVKEEVSKIEINELKKSFHAKVERNYRLKKMKKYGIGNVIATFKVDHDGTEAYATITDNGNLFVSGIEKEVIITMYNMKVNQIRRIFFNGNMPETLYNHIREYNKKFGTL